MKESKRGFRRRVGAWLLTLVMVVGLVTVPAEVAEAGSVEVSLEKDTVTTDDSGNVEIRFKVPDAYNTIQKLKEAGISKLEVKFKVTNYTASGNAGAQAFLGYGEKWVSEGSWTNLSYGTELTSTLDLTKYLSGDESIYAYGIQFANISGNISYEIVSAKLIGTKWDVENADISLLYTSQNQYGAYTEYKFTIENKSNNAVSGDLVITFDRAREKNWWTENFSIGLNSNVLTVSNVTVPANGSTNAIQVQLKPMGVSITSVSFAGKNIAASETKLGDSSGGTSNDYTGSLTYTLPDDCVDDADITPFEKHGALHVDMNTLKLTDANGNPYQLRGVSTHGINWEGNGEYEYEYVNYKSIKNVRDILNADAIRLAMYTAEYNGYTTGGDKNELKYRVDKGVQCATALGMYAIVDWHILNANPTTNMAEAQEFFEYVSKRYSSYNNVLYEICNEPTAGIWADIKSYAEVIVPIIKKNDPDAVIIVGTPQWSQDVDIAMNNPLKDSDNTLMDNVMYTIHFYANEHQDAYRNKLKAALGKIPIFCTEYGMTPASGDGANNFSEAAIWLDLLDENCISYFVWNLSEKPETSSLIKNGSNTWDSWTASNLSESGKWIKEQYEARKTINNTTGSAISVEITLNETAVTLQRGSTKTLTATVIPSNAGTVTWSSDKTSVATVQNGVITAVSEGVAVITAKAGGKTAKCTVTVTAAPAAKLAADKTSITYSALTYGYTNPAAASVTISNTGTAQAVNGTAVLATGSNFTITQPSASISAGGTTTVGVTPKPGLAAGTYKDTITVTYNSNLTISVPVTLTVNKRAITVKAGDVSKIYGEDNPSFTTSITSGSIVGNDDLKINCVTTATKTSDAGTYPITVSANNSNYTITVQSGTLTINKKAVTDIQFPEASAITRGDTLAKSMLTGGATAYGGFAWKNAAAVLSVGNQSAEVVLTLNEKAKKNYSFNSIDGYKESAGTITQIVYVVVNKAGAPQITFPTASAIQYGQQLNASQLTGGSTAYGTFTWENGSAIVNQVGNIQYNVIFTPSSKVEAEYEISTMKKAVTVKVEKADNSTSPQMAVLADRTPNSITVQSANGYEYSKDGKTWQDSSQFTGLGSFTEYKIYTRIKETNTHKASGSSAAISIYTLVADPYKIDISKLGNNAYIEALRTTHTAEKTVQYTSNSQELVLLEGKSKEYTIVGSNQNVTIKTDTGSNKITLNNTTIKKLDMTNSDRVDLVVTGTCKVGEIVSDRDNEVTVSGSGVLNVTTVNITGIFAVKGGTVNADAAGTNGSAIKAGSVNVSGGKVTAAGGGAGIEGSSVNISGGNVTATGGNGSFAVKGDNINITGGTVTADGGISATDTVKISGTNTKVIATGNDGKPAIEGSEIIIVDSNVTATGGNGASAISSTGSISMEDANVTANTAGTGNVPAIKAGEGNDDKITIDGGTVTGNNVDNMYSKIPVDSQGNAIATYKVIVADEAGDNKKVVKSANAGSVIILRAAGKKSYKVSWVDDQGTAYADGESITIKGDVTFTAVYTVIKVESVKVSVAATELEAGKKIAASVKVLPADAADTSVTWSSSNPSVASVDNKGTITAKAKGTAVITATSNDTKISDSVTITVKEASKQDRENGNTDVKAVSMSFTASVKGASKVPVKSTYKLAPKKSMTLKVAFAPEDAVKEKLTFVSSNPKIAKINANGKITAGKKAGKTTITVTSENGLKKTFKVQVMKKPVSKVKIKASKKTIKVKKTVKLKVVTSPSKKNAGNSVYWKSSKPSVATVSSTGKVKGIKKGKAKITAVATDGSGKKATITIKVK